MEIKSIPPEARKSFQLCLEHIQGFGDTVERLRTEIEEFRHRLAAAQKSYEFVDSELAQELAATSVALLQLCTATPRAEFVPYVLAAIAYFVEADDGHPDFENIDGFDDDKEVLDAVIAHFQLLEPLKKFTSVRSA